MLFIQSVQALDQAIAHFFNAYVGLSALFDNAVYFLSKDNLLKVGLVMLAVWGLWFIQDHEQERRRTQLIITLLASLIAIAVGRFLVMFLPHRFRPINDPLLGLHIPDEVNMYAWDTLSSFPSDHAVLFYALSVSLYFVSRKAGIFFSLSSVVLILFPRVYLGYHYASDVIVGALVGAFIGYLVSKQEWVFKLVASKMKLIDQYPHLFYPAMFLLTYQFSVIFSDVRAFFDIIK